MFMARSGVVVATLLVLQSYCAVTTPLSVNTVRDLEKRITCHTTEVAADFSFLLGPSSAPSPQHPPKVALRALSTSCSEYAVCWCAPFTPGGA